MGLRDIEIKGKYRSDEYSDLGVSFVSKMLEQSIVYKRAVGFFSSSALIKITKGLSSFIKNEGARIYLIVSPLLSKEDIEAIKTGYKSREEIIEQSLLNGFKETKDKFEAERLNLLCHLIECGIMDIKVADKIGGSNDELGMFHEKIGIFEDKSGNKIAFSGSLNESDNAYSNNFESILVFKSWSNPEYFLEIEEDFEKLWENQTKNLRIYDFPSAVKEKLFKYKKATYIPDIDKVEVEEKIKQQELDNLPGYYCPFGLYDYQKEAINNWAHQGYRGLFDMGTGTGKTLTAYTASVKLLERLNYHLFTIVVCPYTHLVEQWLEDQKNFHIDFLVGYSDSRYSGYKSKLKQAVQDYNDGIISYFYFITTNSSYKLDDVQKILSEIKGNILLIGDEVHNFGATGIKEVLSEKIKFRLGLSATIERHRDEEGTETIYDYFGKPCIHYGLKEAIFNPPYVLTHYDYYPIVITLTDEEQQKYLELTEKISKNTYFDKSGSVKLKKAGERYALERARVVAAAKNKIASLEATIAPNIGENNMLVYCGTGKITNDIGEEVKQIDEVCSVLGKKLNMRIGRYTSRETVSQRLDIADRFKRGELQALVAIKCLDEGVNIPSIKTAYILASSTNPREYIQRRGRVLRKFPGKTKSYIYDFITLPVPLSKIDDYDNSFVEGFRALARNEVERIKEFSSLADNGSDSDNLMNEISDAFKLNEFKSNPEFEYIEWSYDDDNN